MEWADNCSGDTGQLDSCWLLGGSWWVDYENSCYTLRGWARSLRGAPIGFRCCRDAG
jgi:hypothetical protein